MLICELMTIQVLKHRTKKRDQLLRLSQTIIEQDASGCICLGDGLFGMKCEAQYHKKQSLIEVISDVAYPVFDPDYLFDYAAGLPKPIS